MDLKEDYQQLKDKMEIQVIELAFTVSWPEMLFRQTF